jgi:two-component system alkaline phosphatase synthesis response regulator PhoP
MNRTILLVEDEPGLVLTLRDRLRSEGYDVATASNGSEAIENAAHVRYDLIILDVMLPGRDGLEVCKELRERGVSTPIMMLTARGETADKVLGLRIGADDYVSKPFDMMELMARVEALLRRASRPAPARPSFFQIGPLQVDTQRTEVRRNGEPVLLTAKEFQLLRYLLEHQGMTVSRGKLLKDVWGYNSPPPTTRTVDVHVAWLRQKLETDPQDPRLILTVHGLGYKFAD